MKISTNCSPLVIYFGFFFPDKTITLGKGRGRMGWGWVGGGRGATRELSTRKGGRTKGTDLGTEVYFCYRGEQRFGGLPICTHTLLEKKESGSACKGVITFHQAT